MTDLSTKAFSLPCYLQSFCDYFGTVWAPLTLCLVACVTVSALWGAHDHRMESHHCPARLCSESQLSAPALSSDEGHRTVGQQKVVFPYVSKIQQLQKGPRLSSRVLFSVGLRGGQLAGLRDILTSGTLSRHGFESMGCWQNMGWSWKYILMELESEWRRALTDS